MSLHGDGIPTINAGRDKENELGRGIDDFLRNIIPGALPQSIGRPQAPPPPPLFAPTVDNVSPELQLGPIGDLGGQDDPAEPVGRPFHTGLPGLAPTSPTQFGTDAATTSQAPISIEDIIMMIVGQQQVNPIDNALDTIGQQVPRANQQSPILQQLLGVGGA